MKIAGFVKTSFVDFPGKIASVVFTQGCNLRCGYCHNPGLLDSRAAAAGIPPEQLFEYLYWRKDLIEAVVFSGGEPTLQKDLDTFIREVKALNLLIKLDTNGTNPQALARLIENRLLDFIAMDLKAPLRDYERIAKAGPAATAAIRESTEIIKAGGVPYEFRTTLCPELTAEDIPVIVSDFALSANYVIQNCRDAEQKKFPRSEPDLKRLAECSEENSFLSLRGF